MILNTKLLLTITSAVLALAGVGALFAPELFAAGAPPGSLAPVVAQLLGALYLAFAMVNWTARESVIGGVYARPVSLGNFGHFLIGALVLAKVVLAGGASTLVIVALLVYAVFAVIFGWLVLVATGLPPKPKA